MNAVEIKKFKRFLKEEGIFKLFFKRYDPKYRSFGRWFIPSELEYTDFTLGHDDEKITDYLSSIDYNLAIFSAFEWGSTKEGFSFWHKISNKWVGIQFISYAYEY
jgi:hypothetical protein